MLPVTAIIMNSCLVLNTFYEFSFYIFLLFFCKFIFFFFWIDTLRRISCWDLLLLLRLITGFKSFYMQQLQMQSKFNFSLSLLNDFPSILFNSLATLSLSLLRFFSLCIGYCLIINVACSLSMPECWCVWMFVCVCVWLFVVLLWVLVCGCLFCFLPFCCFLSFSSCFTFYFYLHRNWSFLNNYYL